MAHNHSIRSQPIAHAFRRRVAQFYLITSSAEAYCFFFLAILFRAPMGGDNNSMESAYVSEMHVLFFFLSIFSLAIHCSVGDVNEAWASADTSGRNHLYLANKIDMRLKTAGKNLKLVTNAKCLWVQHTMNFQCSIRINETNYCIPTKYQKSREIVMKHHSNQWLPWHHHSTPTRKRKACMSHVHEALAHEKPIATQISIWMNMHVYYDMTWPIYILRARCRMPAFHSLIFLPQNKPNSLTKVCDVRIVSVCVCMVASFGGAAHSLYKYIIYI